MSNDVLCTRCNEELDGDGYTSVLRCPNRQEDAEDLVDCAAPDEGPFYCDYEDSDE